MQGNNLQKNEIIEGNLGEYKAIEQISQGMFARSWRGKCVITYDPSEVVEGDKVFIKYYVNPLKDDENYKSFVKHQEEIKKALEQIIPRTIVENNYDFFEYEDFYFQVKEFIDGKSLKEHMWDNEGNIILDFETGFKFAYQIMGCIKKLHENDIIHCDFKPEQILVEVDNDTDTGYHLIINDFDWSICKNSIPYQIVDTDKYKSPESFRKNIRENISKKTDIYVCGIILYYLLLHSYPYKSDDIESEKINYKIDKPKDLWPQLFENGKEDMVHLGEIMEKMLNPDPKLRPNAEEVHLSLKKALNAHKIIEFPDLIKNTYIKLTCNENTHYIWKKKEKITRELCKQVFGKYQQIYKKQFSINKGSEETWYITGESVPKTYTSSKTGKTFNFYNTELNGKDVTNEFVELSDGDVISVGDTIFNVNIEERED